MKYTNLHNLPEPIARAVKHDEYDAQGDISATGLILPPQIAYLREKHKDELTEDVSDGIYRLIGSAIHKILEWGDADNALKEERLTLKVNGWEVSGKLDLYHGEGLIQDYKITPVWSWILGNKIEWERQLNIYAALYRENGFVVDKIQVVAIFRDWSKRKAMYDKGYPPAQCLPIDIPLWTHEKAMEFIDYRVRHSSTGRGQGTFPGLFKGRPMGAA